MDLNDTTTKIQDVYDLSPFGFLSTHCHQLPKNYQFMKTAVNAINEKAGNNMRQAIMQLPSYNPKIHSLEMVSLDEIKSLYSVMCMIVSRYVWATGFDDAQKYSVLPEIIGMPFVLSAQALGIAPSLTYTAVDLYNWEFVNPTQPFGLDNIAACHLMTGTEDEQWFHKIMIAIEGICGSLLTNIYIAVTHEKNIREVLESIESALNQSRQLVKRTYEGCNAEIFFHKIRIYLGGSENDHLPCGLLIEDHADITLKYKGGSAAQSSVIQVFDAFLGIQHEDPYILLIRDYMPKKHRAFIEHIETHRNDQLFSNHQKEYIRCVDALKKFRQAHLGLVQHYILQFIKTDATNNSHKDKGSGGTHPKVFCNQMIKETRW
ncbi:3-dioxygenase [uncultured virus]|nr:3-dioxygenase [uncultured virus]